jgi:hypothetical protein
MCTISHVIVADVTSPETSRPEVRIKEPNYNLTQGLLKKAKLAQRAYEEGHKICWKEAKVVQVEPNTIYRKYKESAHVCDRSSDQSTLRRHLSHVENYNSIQCRLCVEAMFLCWLHTENIYL